jgi:ABC-2 type transport system ATP-binding protein
MSKGMKQKLAIVVAFMAKPSVLILDEPTSGLDPLMQLEFDKLVLEFKQAGATILLSSHIFSEIEKVCDRVSIIKNGKMIMETNLNEIENDPNKEFKIEVIDKKNYEKFHSLVSKNHDIKIIADKKEKNQIILGVHDKNINKLIEILYEVEVKFVYQHVKSLEEVFMKYYSNDKDYSFRKIKDNILKGGKNA